MREPISVLIADDHPLFRKGLRALLATLPQLQVVGEATSGSEAVRLAEELYPQLVLMDLQMPNGDGLSAIRQLAARQPETNILVITMFEDDDSVFAALRAGARGYVLKDMDDDEMARAMLAVGNGEAIFSPAIAQKILTFLANPPSRTERPFPELTESEYHVLRLMARGFANDAVAAELAFSPKTVRNYISSIFSKLHVADRGQAIIRARDAGVR